MRFGESSTSAMTHISMKIGRFICHSAVEVGNAKVNGRRFRCNGDKYVDEEVEEEEEGVDDVMPQLRIHSTPDLQDYFRFNRKLSLPDFRTRGFECADLEREFGAEGEEEEDLDNRSGSDAIPWRDYNETLCPHENDRILSLLNRVVRPRDSESRDYDVDDDSPEVRDGGAETESPVIPLPWRTKDAMSGLEDASKYLWEAGGLDEATPQVKVEDEGHPLASFHQSSSPSSSSFRNIPSFDDAPRPDLSACHSFSVSHWLSEAESRHSEPFCLPHHHLASPPAEPPSIRSSVNGNRVPVAPPHDPHPRRGQASRDRSRSGSTGSSGRSFPYLIPGEGGGGEEAVESPGQCDQVLRWLMVNDLEATACLDEADDQKSSGQFDL